MDATTIALIAGAVLLWAVVSDRLERSDITAPMALLALGVLADVSRLVEIAPDDVPLGLVAQATLALLLFSDAARVDLFRLRHDAGLPVRMLGIGLPLTIGAGVLAARVLFPDNALAGALLVAACLAPTDAGLGAVIVSDRRVPRRVRRTLNVESGLNDGIAAPVVTLAIALVAEEQSGAGDVVAHALRELGLGAVFGIVVGGAGSWLLVRATRRGWLEHGATTIAVLALAVLAHTAALAVGGNGFIAAFVGGLAFGSGARTIEEERRRARPSLPVGTGGGEDEDEDDEEDTAPLALTELGGLLLSGVVWFLFGAAVLPEAVQEIDGAVVAYALLSLTVVRMVPIALSLVGTDLALPTLAFLGWFGPRGLASIVFAVEALDELGPQADAVLSVVGITVLLSVVAHGASARPLAGRYGAWSRQQDAGHPARAGTPAFRPRRGMADSGSRWARSSRPSRSPAP